MRIIRCDDRPFVPAGHEDPRDPGVWKKVLLQKADVHAGALQMINWAKLPPGRNFAAHYHEDMQEVFVMLGGTARVMIGAESAVLQRGDSIVIDRREVHQMWNDGEEDVEYLAVGISGGMGGRTVVVG